MLDELGPGEGISFRVATILFNSTQYKICLGFTEKPLLSCPVWKVEDNEPSLETTVSQLKLLE